MKKVLTIPNLIRLGLLMTLILPFIWLTACEDQNKLTPDTKDSTQTDPCKTKHTGDVCFKNSMSGMITVHLDGGGFNTPSPITIVAGQIGCFYDLKAGSHSWDSRVGFDANTARSGNIKIFECKSDTVEIK